MTDLRKEIEDALEWVQGETQALEMANRALGGWVTKQIARKYDHLKTILRSLEASLKLLDEGDGLKECPFCGGEAEFCQGQKGDGTPWIYIACEDCEAMAPFGSDDKKHWNTRHSEALKTLRGEE